MARKTKTAAIAGRDTFYVTEEEHPPARRGGLRHVG